MEQVPTSLQATLALVPAMHGHAPSGALITPDGLRRGFNGWIELASAIEDWRQRHELPAVVQPIRSEDVT